MSSEWDEIPPAPPLATVAAGVSAQGERWTVTAGGTRERCFTFMDIELPDGQATGGGGLAGPVLPPGGFMNCSVHWADCGGARVRYLVGRVHPSVKRVHLDLADGDTSGLDLKPVGESAEFGVSFVAAVLPRSGDLTGISVWDGAGHRIDRQDIRPGLPSEGGRPSPGSGASGAPGGDHSGWRPLGPDEGGDRA